MSKKIYGSGLGLRRSFMRELLESESQLSMPDFFEVAPENWIGMGGRYRQQLMAYGERFPIVAHGLSLSIGGLKPLDIEFVNNIKKFIQDFDIKCYSEHLSYTGDDGHLYDLLPIPFTEEAVKHVAQRIQQVQDILQQRIALENVSYYAAPCQDLSELEFLLAVITEADCDLLLDVNNILVNSINHSYQAINFIDKLPTGRIRYLHIAGHYVEAEDLRIDTHGDDVCADAWQLLEYTYQRHGVLPTLLERDFNIPPIIELIQEVETIRDYQRQGANKK